MWLVLACASSVYGDEAAPRQTRPLRVATSALAPFVIKEGDRFKGFSVDLWNELARRMGVEFVWVDAGSRADQLESVARGNADVAISAIVMTPERERVIDFSQAYFDSGCRSWSAPKRKVPFLPP
ncbi:transporter substrate-binding domain-containing protein [Variovorax robiniae]|uniref:Transporter substrate-binding domain-containing protein n=1 Tax=Variovorax robiniae TaxID=1836199 RepID=A0ABU8XIU8_9BURK